MNDIANINDIFDQIHKDLDKFKENLIQNNRLNPDHWPLELPKNEINTIFEQFMMYNPNEPLNAVIDYLAFIQSIGFTRAYEIIKKCPNGLNYYKPSNGGYYRCEGFCILVDKLKEELDKLTAGTKIKATFDYTDMDYPYAYHDTTTVEFFAYSDIDDWINRNSHRRSYYTIQSIEWLD